MNFYMMLGVFTALGGAEVMNYFFGGGVPVIGIYLAFVGLDILTGYIKALKDHSWMSSVNLYGLLTKFVAFITIIMAAGLDKIAPILGVQLPINVALIWTILLCLYEAGSILENAHAVGLKTHWLLKWLHVFEETANAKSPDEEKEDEK